MLKQVLLCKTINDHCQAGRLACTESQSWQTGVLLSVLCAVRSLQVLRGVSQKPFGVGLLEFEWGCGGVWSGKSRGEYLRTLRCLLQAEEAGRSPCRFPHPALEKQGEGIYEDSPLASPG